jgi:hypothetical protein
MTERQIRRVWFGGLFFGLAVTRLLGRRFPIGSAVAFCASAVWFVVWLVVDNLRFRKEIASQRQRLDQRRAAVRAAKDAALRRGPDEGRS